MTTATAEKEVEVSTPIPHIDRMDVVGHFRERPPVEVGLVHITPSLADEWLRANTHNRPIRARVLMALVSDLREGNYQLNGESIVFSDTGRLNDAGHRLTAIAQSGIAAWSVVVWGVTEESQETVDSGLPRSVSDVWHLRGETNARDLAAAIRHVWTMETQGEIGTAGQSFRSPTKTDLSDSLARHPDIRTSHHVGHEVKQLIPQRALTIALHYLFTSLDAGDGAYFFARLADGQGLVVGNPIYTLREALLRDRAAPRSMSLNRRAAIVVRAWNAYRRGESLTKFQWTPANDFPLPE